MSVFTAQSNGWSTLFFAAERGDVDTVDLLINAGANPRLTDQVSHISCCESDIPFLPFLSHLPHPSLSHFPLQNGLTAEAVAAASDHAEVCQMLSMSLATRFTQVFMETWCSGLASISAPLDHQFFSSSLMKTLLVLFYIALAMINLT